MSSEIVPFVDGSDNSSADEPHDDTWKGKAAVVEVTADSAGIFGRPSGPMYEDVRCFDLLGLRSAGRPTVNLIGRNQDITHFLSPEKGPKCTTQLNPTPGSVNSLLDKIKEAFVLHLRGCDQLFLPEASPFPFEKFKTLTCLEISGVSNLTSLPENKISEMTNLQALNLSHLPIQQLSTAFLSNLTKLHSLTLNDCPNIHSLPELPPMTALKYLELSHLLIETLPEKFFYDGLKELERLILRGCSKLSSLPSIQPLENLRELDLSHCTALQEINLKGVWMLLHFWKLDLSYTALHFTYTLDIGGWTTLTHLFVRDAKVINLQAFPFRYKLEVLDVSGAQHVEGLDILEFNKKLEALDLSRTGIESIDFISGQMNLRYLILRDCTRLQKLPTMKKMTQLEVLDISGCEILGDLPKDISSLKRLKELNLSGCSGLKELSPSLFDQMSCLEKVDISKTNTNHLPCFASLTNLPYLNISQTSSVKQVATTVTNLDTLDVAAPSESRIHPRLLNPNEFYIVSTFFINSGFDRFRQHFNLIVDLISRFQENFEPVSSLDTIPIFTANMWDEEILYCDKEAKTDAKSCPIGSETVKMQCRRMVADLKYIRDNIGLLESCPNCTSAEKHLDKLTEARYHLKPSLLKNISSDYLSQFYFRLNSINFYVVLRIVVKLKLLIPPKRVDVLEEKENRKMEKMQSRGGHDQLIISDSGITTPEMEKLSCCYESLTNIEKNCLLHFAVFMDSIFKERKIIQLWYGEGLIDPQHSRKMLLFQMLIPPQIETMQRLRVQAQRVSNVARLYPLFREGFIQRFEPVNQESRMWRLLDYTRYFVRVRAMEEGFFNVDHKTRMFTPHLTGSQRACLLISQNNLPSSCKLWADYINSSEKMECFKTIRTLVNVNVLIVDIRSQWFSKMTNLAVFHLGICYRPSLYEHESIEVVDLKFLEELKNMKQLRLLNLEGFSAMKKLPDSVCKVTNLRILNLRECSYLEELPAGIGSLKNLTHLDLTDCPVLCMLPKGIRLMSKLEVLKGFVIYYQIGGRQHQNACTLRDLFKLEKLRKLNLVVHTEGFPFPDSSDLHVFNRMKNLCSLKIIWQQNHDNLDQHRQDIVEQKALKQYSSRWQQLKCWQQQERHNETEEILRSNLQELELRCFPYETAPNWLHPSGLQKLQKLKVRGGDLTTLVQGGKLPTLDEATNQNTWNVKTLGLAYLPNMYMNEDEVRHGFPKLTCYYKYKCGDECPLK